MSFNSISSQNSTVLYYCEAFLSSENCESLLDQENMIQTVGAGVLTLGLLVSLKNTCCSKQTPPKPLQDRVKKSASKTQTTSKTASQAIPKQPALPVPQAAPQSQTHTEGPGPSRDFTRSTKGQHAATPLAAAGCYESSKLSKEVRKLLIQTVKRGD